MKVQQYKIVIPSAKQKIVLIPFCCIHYDNPGCHLGKVHEFIQRAKAPNVYTLGLGDNLDFARTTYRTMLRAARPDDTSPEYIDMLIRTRLDKFIEEIGEPIAPRCIGMLKGNHTWEFITTDKTQGFLANESSEEYICNKLGVNYLDESAIIQLLISVKDTNIKDTFTIVTNHGYGNGGQTAGSDLTALEKKEAAFDVDMYVTGHTHRRLGHFLSKIRLDPKDLTLKEKPALLVKAGAFLRAYIPGKTTYASGKLMRPLDLGWVEVHLGYKVKKDGEVKRVAECVVTQEADI